MDEQQWLSCDDPRKMLEFLRGTAGDRKLRLFAAAWLRGYEAHLPGVCRRAVEAAERYADGGLSEGGLAAAWWQARRYSGHALRKKYRLPPWSKAVQLLMLRAGAAQVACRRIESVLGVASHVVAAGRSDGERQARRRGEMARQAGLLRDIFGNPFRPVTLDRQFISPDAVPLARSMYDARDFAAMPVLADALEDAGCTSDDVLSHCRGGGDHVRGCWVVDLVLGKE